MPRKIQDHRHSSGRGTIVCSFLNIIWCIFTNSVTIMILKQLTMINITLHRTSKPAMVFDKLHTLFQQWGYYTNMSVKQPLALSRAKLTDKCYIWAFVSFRKITWGIKFGRCGINRKPKHGRDNPTNRCGVVKNAFSLKTFVSDDILVTQNKNAIHRETFKLTMKIIYIINVPQKLFLGWQTSMFVGTRGLWMILQHF